MSCVTIFRFSLGDIADFCDVTDLDGGINDWETCWKKKELVSKCTKHYVDDINIIINSKYRGEDQDEQMFEEIKSIGNSIHTSI